MPDATDRSYREGARTIRTATWSIPPGVGVGVGASRVLEHVAEQRWATRTDASQSDDGPVTVVVEVAERDRWYVDRRIQTVGQLLARACGSVHLVSVVPPAPHTNRQPSVDARQAQRAELRAARAARVRTARAQNPGHAQVHGQAEQEREQGSDPVAVD